MEEESYGTEGRFGVGEVHFAKISEGTSQDLWQILNHRTCGSRIASVSRLL